MRKMKESVFSGLLLYLVITLIGTIVMSFPGFGYLNPVYYASVLFYVLAFFNVIAYFYGREDRKDYELLYFCLINVLCASYLFISNYANAPFTLGTGFLIYTILVAVNRSFHTYNLKRKNNPMWIVRGMATILILFLGILTIQNFYRELTSVQTLMIGYYFVTFGIVSLIETVVLSFVSPTAFEKFLNGKFDELKEEIKIIKRKKIKNENVRQLDEVIDKIEVPKKKKHKNNPK